MDVSADVWWLWRMIFTDFTSSRKKKSSTFVRLKLGKGVSLVSCKYMLGNARAACNVMCMAHFQHFCTGGWDGETIRWRTPTSCLQIFQKPVTCEKKPWCFVRPKRVYLRNSARISCSLGSYLVTVKAKKGEKYEPCGSIKWLKYT